MGRKNFKGKEDYPALFSPLRIGNIRLKNRIIAAPTSPSMITTEGHFTPEIIAYLEEKARGGAAVVTYGEAIVHSATGKSHNKQLQLDSFGVREGLAKAARAIHNAGAYANIQLSHGGMYGGLESVGGDVTDNRKAYGPSSIIMPQGEVEEMPKELIAEILEAYEKGARLVKDCGFDMVQVHAAHGWLFSQFLSPVFNRRTDEFGGTLENRARFLLLALDAVREGVGPGFPIEIRLSGDDLTENGLSQEDCIRVAEMVQDKVDLFNISCGNHEDPDIFCRTHPSAFYARGINVYLAAEIKKHVSKPVACVGALNDPAMMEKILENHEADAVEIARGLLADPYLPEKALKGDAEDITPCLRCYECFGEVVKSETLKCTVNPTMGEQLQHQVPGSELQKVKRVLVAGGGPAGMQAAITAALRGHDVVLAEKQDRLGGNLHPAGAAYFKQDILKLLSVLERRVEKAGVKVFLNTEVTAEYIKKTDPDVLITAIGARELKPPIKGIDSPSVIMASEAELHPEKLGKKVVIMGGGLVGAEAAVSFRHDGHEVVIVEMKGAVAEEVNSFYRGGLMPEVEKAAEIHTKTAVTEIRPDGVYCEKDGETFFIEADSVVCALGFRSPVSLVDELCSLVDEAYMIGDCVRSAQIYQAISQGYHTALLL